MHGHSSRHRQPQASRPPSGWSVPPHPLAELNARRTAPECRRLPSRPGRWGHRRPGHMRPLYHRRPLYVPVHRDPTTGVVAVDHGYDRVRGVWGPMRGIGWRKTSARLPRQHRRWAISTSLASHRCAALTCWKAAWTVAIEASSSSTLRARSGGPLRSATRSRTSSAPSTPHRQNSPPA